MFATVIWVAILAGLYGLLAWRLRGTEDTLLAIVFRPVCWVYVRLFHQLTTFPDEGDPVPGAGPAILVANHRSGVDPLLIGVLTKRRVKFLMAREYYEVPLLKYAFQSLGCIPVNRDGNDLGATKAALKALKNGEVVGIFPQGGIRQEGGSVEGKAGVALLALKTGAPVIPFYIRGSRNLDAVLLSLLVPTRTRVYCGVPHRFSSSSVKPSREELESVTDEICDSIARLRPLLPKPDAG